MAQLLMLCLAAVDGLPELCRPAQAEILGWLVNLVCRLAAAPSLANKTS